MTDQLLPGMEQSVKKRKDQSSISSQDETLDHSQNSSLLSTEDSPGLDCQLVSPYKRLRVADLTQSSVESTQAAGENEAHSLLSDEIFQADTYIHQPSSAFVSSVYQNSEPCGNSGKNGGVSRHVTQTFVSSLHFRIKPPALAVSSVMDSEEGVSEICSQDEDGSRFPNEIFVEESYHCHKIDSNKGEMNHQNSNITALVEEVYSCNSADAVKVGQKNDRVSPIFEVTSNGNNQEKDSSQSLTVGSKDACDKVFLPSLTAISTMDKTCNENPTKFSDFVVINDHLETTLSAGSHLHSKISNNILLHTVFPVTGQLENEGEEIKVLNSSSSCCVGPDIAMPSGRHHTTDSEELMDNPVSLTCSQYKSSLDILQQHSQVSDQIHDQQRQRQSSSNSSSVRYHCSSSTPMSHFNAPMIAQGGLTLHMVETRFPGFKQFQANASYPSSVEDLHYSSLGDSYDQQSQHSSQEDLQYRSLGSSYGQQSQHSSQEELQYRSLGSSYDQQSQHSSQEDLQYQSRGGSCSGSFQNHSAESLARHSLSSRTSTDHTDQSYPSSLAMSGHGTKKAVLQSSGHLRLSAYWNVGLLTIHVVQARCLASCWKSHCDSYVKMSLVPDQSRRTRCKTRIQHNTNNPVYDEKFSLEILEEDRKKRLVISVWHRDPDMGASEFLGCMSFGVGHLLKKNLDGWYNLLTEDVGRRKHLQSHDKIKPVVAVRGHQNVPLGSRRVRGQEKLVITITRGKSGFGFSFVDEFPPKVGRVDQASPADLAGMKKGDLIIKINERNVSRSTCEGVAHMIKKMNPSTLTVEVLRERSSMSQVVEVTANDPQQARPGVPRQKQMMGTSTDNICDRAGLPTSADSFKENQSSSSNGGGYDDEYGSDDDLHYLPYDLDVGKEVMNFSPANIQPGLRGSSVPASHDLSRQEAIHRLMSLELNYIDFMRYGIERYSRPLRHGTLSAQQHQVMFQNIEQLVAISEDQVQQLQENSCSSSISTDTDNSHSIDSSLFPHSVALIYFSKVQSLTQAYQVYAAGLGRSIGLLRDLMKNAAFVKCVSGSDVTNQKYQPESPSIGDFMNRPIVHIQDLCAILREIFLATSASSPDAASLQHVVIKLSECVAVITGSDGNGSGDGVDCLMTTSDKSGSQTNSSSQGSMASLLSADSSESSVSSATDLMGRDILHPQRALYFAPRLLEHQLQMTGKNLVYQSQVFRYTLSQWNQSQLLLFTDLLLMATEQPNGSLLVGEEPISLQDLCGIESDRKFATEFCLHLQTSPLSHSSRQAKFSNCSGNERHKTLILRATSVEEKIVWKSLLEQRIKSQIGSKIMTLGFLKDISNSNSRNIKLKQ